MSQTRIPFKRFTEGDFIHEIRRLNRTISKLSDERDELKDRIEKAIEYIEKDTKYDEEHKYYDVDVEDILNILSMIKGDKE